MKLLLNSPRFDSKTAFEKLAEAQKTRPNQNLFLIRESQSLPGVIVLTLLLKDNTRKEFMFDPNNFETANAMVGEILDCAIEYDACSPSHIFNTDNDELNNITNATQFKDFRKKRDAAIKRLAAAFSKLLFGTDCEVAITPASWPEFIVLNNKDKAARLPKSVLRQIDAIFPGMLPEIETIPYTNIDFTIDDLFDQSDSSFDQIEESVVSHAIQSLLDQNEHDQAIDLLLSDGMYLSKNFSTYFNHLKLFYSQSNALDVLCKKLENIPKHDPRFAIANYLLAHILVDKIDDSKNTTSHAEKIAQRKMLLTYSINGLAIDSIQCQNLVDKAFNYLSGNETGIACKYENMRGEPETLITLALAIREDQEKIQAQAAEIADLKAQLAALKEEHTKSNKRHLEESEAENEVGGNNKPSQKFKLFNGTAKPRNDKSYGTEPEAEKEFRQQQ